eukprot:SAG31_NODE_4492_length_3188_cov_3.281716_1_plen_95_part_00
MVNAGVDMFAVASASLFLGISLGFCLCAYVHDLALPTLDLAFGSKVKVGVFQIFSSVLSASNIPFVSIWESAVRPALRARLGFQLHSMRRTIRV